MDATNDLTTNILRLAEAQDAAALEDAWLDLLTVPPTELEFYREFVRVTRRHKLLDTAYSLLVMLLEELQNRAMWRGLDPILRFLAPTWPDSPDLRKIAGRAIRALNESDPNLPHMLAACKGLALPQVFVAIDELKKLEPGNVFRHAYWGDGIVRELDLGANRTVIDFETQPGKALEVGFARKHLTWLPPTSFGARRTADPEPLRTLAQDAPAELIKLVLADNDGRIKQAELKKTLQGSIIQEDEWNSWWTNTRGVLRADPFIEFDAKRGANAEIVLRDHPKTPDEELLDLFQDPATPFALRVSAFRKATAIEPATLSQIAAGLEARRSSATMPAEELDAELLLEEVAARAGKAKSVSWRDKLDRISASDIAALSDPQHVAAVLHEWLAGHGQEGTREALAAVPSSSATFANAVWNELHERGAITQFAPVARTVLDDPMGSPDLFLWATKTLLEDNELSEFYPTSVLVPELMEQIDACERLVDSPGADRHTQATAKQVISRLRTLLQARQYAPIRVAAEHMTTDQAQRLLRAILNSDALNSTFKAAAEKQILAAKPELDKLKETSAPAQTVASDIHYCTAAAREQKLAELRELQTVTIPANALEIEHARQEGDLKENAGYIFGKEKQKLLMQRLMQLQQDVASARVFGAESVKTDTIGFGVGFEALNLSSGESETYTVLGRFETDPDRHILSYQSPFMQPFVGKGVEDEVMVERPNGARAQYRITRIWNALTT